MRKQRGDHIPWKRKQGSLKDILMYMGDYCPGHMYELEWPVAGFLAFLVIFINSPCKFVLLDRLCKGRIILTLNTAASSGPK